MADEQPSTPENFPGISIVVPAYNYDRYLPFAVESARNQEYPEFEVVVIDDGSTDDTAEVMKQFGPPVRYIHQKNAGLSAARNSGIREAKHDFILFLDADDELKPGILKEMMRVFMGLESGYGLMGCDRVLIDADGKKLPTAKPSEPEGEVSARDILMRTRFSPTGALCRKEVFEKAGGFDTTLRSTEDRDMWIRIAEKYRVYYLNQELIHIRKHGSNMSSNAARQSSNMVVVLGNAHRRGTVPRSNFWFWREVFAYQKFESALMFNGAGKPFKGLWLLLVSILTCPWFFDRGRFNYPFLFRVRHAIRYVLNILTGRAP